jgi:glycosyltransferase involved in cell wall biosynthesis
MAMPRLHPNAGLSPPKGLGETMSLVSVVIPSYNHASYIPHAVASVLGQTHADLELIVVDDGSTDASADYLRSLRDPRLRLIEQANAGAHHAINRGLAMARGDWLAILNSDDAFHPDRLRQILSFAVERRADLVTSWIEVIDDQGKVLGIKEGWRNMLPWPIRELPSAAGEDSFLTNLYFSNFVSTTSNVVFSRHLYDGIGGMRNLRFAHDWDFLLRAASGFRCAQLEAPLVRYRIHGSNTISTNRAWMLFEICWVLAVALRRSPASPFFAGDDRDSLAHDVARIGGCINFQGNDKVFWMIRQFIDAREQAGDTEPELQLLDDKTLRDAFVACIQL